MTRQEEIREGVAKEYMAATDMEYRVGDGKRCIFVDQILNYLHSQGVVIEHIPLRGEDLTGTHLTRTEPLIEEVT